MVAGAGGGLFYGGQRAAGADQASGTGWRRGPRDSAGNAIRSLMTLAPQTALRLTIMKLGGNPRRGNCAWG